MSLVLCPECAEWVSECAVTCIKCGYPLHEDIPDEEGIRYYRICPKCGKIYNDTCCNNCGTPTVSTHYKEKFISFNLIINSQHDLSSMEKWEQSMREKYVINSTEYDEALYKELIRKETSERDTLDKAIKEAEEREHSQPTCPKCHSTAIGVVNRGYSFWTGFLGSGSPRNVCQNCGYRWKPGN